MIRHFIMVAFLLMSPVSIWAQDISLLKKGVVKITAQVEGKTKVGTGFIVRLDKDAAYIVTASHVIEGARQPQVVFFTKQMRMFPARVLGLDGGNPKGLAALLVEGDLPPGLQDLPLNPDFEVTGGEPITIIGFPRIPPVPWAVSHGAMTGQEGQNLIFAGAATEGNSGGPLMIGGKVVGVVTELTGQYGYAVPDPIVRVSLRGWGVSLGIPKGTGQATPGLRTIRIDEKIQAKDGNDIKLVYYKSKRVNLKEVSVDSVKIAAFNPQTVLDRSKEGSRVKDRLRAFLADRQRIIEQDEAHLRSLEKQLQSGNRSLQQEFKERYQKYQSNLKDYNAEFEKRKKDALDIFNTRLENSVRHIAERDGWELILDNFETDPKKILDLLSSEVRDLLNQELPNISAAVIEDFDQIYK